MMFAPQCEHHHLSGPHHQIPGPRAPATSVRRGDRARARRPRLRARVPDRARSDWNIRGRSGVLEGGPEGEVQKEVVRTIDCKVVVRLSRWVGRIT